MSPASMRRFWGWVSVCLGLLLLARSSWATEEEGYLPVHVCVRPPYLHMDVVIWTYYASTTDFIYVLPADYATKRYKFPTYLYDPEAPPENTKQLPREEDRKRPCDPKPPARPPKASEEAPKPKTEEHRQASPAPARAVEKKEEPSARSAPVARTKMPEEEEEERRQRAWRARDGVTKDWPSSVLPRREASQDRTVLRKADKNDPSTTVLPYEKVLPTRRSDDICAWALPPGGMTEAKRAETCAGRGKGKGHGKGDGDGDAELRTWLGKATTDMAVLAAVVNMQFDEDLERKDGRRYGIVGGKDLDGPDSALVQAFASITMVAAVVLSAETEAFEKKLKDALAKGKQLLMKDMEKVGKGVAEELAKKEAQKVEQKILQQTGKPLKAEARLAAEKDAREALAHTLRENGGAIGPYEKMTQFTEKLGGQYQAHHILEEQWARKLELGDPAKVPSVILTEAEHKEITAKLAAAAREIKERRQKMNPERLWKMYQKVYEGHSDWLTAIKPYFFKGK